MNALQAIIGVVWLPILIVVVWGIVCIYKVVTTRMPGIKDVNNGHK